MGFSAEVAVVNDRVRRLAERVKAFDELEESGLHPAVREDEGSAATVAAVMGQLAFSRVGRGLIALAIGRTDGKEMSVAEAEVALVGLMKEGVETEASPASAVANEAGAEEAASAAADAASDAAVAGAASEVKQGEKGKREAKRG
jgi:hypothetical protein